jgi:DNA primase
MNELEDIKNKIDIVEYVGKYVQLRQAGRNFKGLCPFHTEKTPSFMVSPDKQIWHCFGCNEGGDVISFVEKVEGLTFTEALKDLAQKAGVKLPDNFSKHKEPLDKLYEINEETCKIFERNLFKPEGKRPLDYLKKRGLTDTTIKEYRLGFAQPQGEAIVKELTTLGYSKDDLVKAGVANSKNNRVIDQFRNRLTFPITNVGGRVIGFSARVLDDSLPKYINTFETPIYHKSNVLFGLDKAKEQARKQDHLILVEGNMDVIFSHQAGVRNVVAASGTALTEAQLDIIKRFTKNIKISFDVDLAGQNATRRAIELAQNKGFNLKVIEVPEGKDPADLVKNDPKKWINACKKAKYVVDYIFESTFDKYDITNILDKKRATKELLEVISRLPDPVEKEHYLQVLSTRVGVRLQALIEALAKHKRATKTKTKVATTEKEEIKKHESLEEHVFSLLLLAPEYAHFFSNKLTGSDFREQKIQKYATELIEEADKTGEVKLDRWRENLSKDERVFINTLTLQAEDRYGDLSDEALSEEIFNSVLRLKRTSLLREKQEISRKIEQAEKAKDRAKALTLMSEFQKIIEKERNI